MKQTIMIIIRCICVGAVGLIIYEGSFKSMIIYFCLIIAFNLTDDIKRN